jgi:hypothetical protein
MFSSNIKDINKMSNNTPVFDIKVLAGSKNNNKFSEITFNNTNVIMNTKTGYINATKLCNDNNKNFYRWLEYNKENNELLNYYDCKTYFSGGSFHLVKDDEDINNKLINGIYIHPHLIVHVARWISPEISWNISEIISKCNLF